MTSAIQRAPFQSLLILTVLANIGMGIVIPVLPIYFKQYDVTIAALSAPYATLVLGRLCSRLIGPGIIMRSGHRLAIMGGFMLYALVFAAYLGADSLYQFGALRFVEGVVEGILGVALNDLAIAYTKGVDSNQRVHMMGRFGSAFGLGFLLGPLAGSAVCYGFGMSAIFVTGSLLGVAAVALSGIMLVNVAPSVAPLGSLRRRMQEAWLLIGLYSPQSLRRVLFFSLMILLPLHVTGYLHLKSEYVGLFFAASAVFTTFLMPMSVRLTKRIGTDITVSGGLCVMAVSLLALGIVSDPLLFATIFIIETAAFALMLPAAMAIFSEAVENHPERTKVIGTMAFVTELLSLPPAFLLPFLYAVHPDYGWEAVALLCVGTYLLFDSSRRRVMKVNPAGIHGRHPSPIAREPRKQEQA